MALTSTSARAQEPVLTVELASLTVTGAKGSDDVVLRVTVTNTSDLPAYGVRAVLWRSLDPIQDLPTLREVAGGQSSWGTRLDGKPAHSARLSAPNEAFAPRASKDVTLRATLAELGFTTRGAAYAFGAVALGTAEPGGVELPLGRLTTFVSVPGRQAVPVTPIVVLSSAPAKVFDGVFVDDHLADELSDRLDDLLTAATRPGMSWLIDPALLDAVTDMADGYVVSGAEGETPGLGQEKAAAWLARLKALESDAGAQSLFANPDVTGAASAKDDQVLARAKTATMEAAAGEEIPLLVLPAEAVLTPTLQTYLVGAGADAILASNAVEAGAWQTGLDDTGVVVVSSALGTETDSSSTARAQLALAEAVVAGTSGQARLITSTQDLVVDALATSDWTKRRSLGDLLASTRSAEPAGFEIIKADRLSKSQFRELTRLEGDFGAYSDLVPESTLTPQAAAALTRGAASAWIDDAPGHRRLTDAIADTIGEDAVADGVTLDASARFLMSSRTNEFPLTVTNQLTEPILVRVVITTDNPQRLTIPPSELVTVGPGLSQTVNVRPEASSNGVVMARAHVETASGQRVTSDIPITVEITELGMVGWVIVLTSGFVLIAATVWRIRQVRRRNAEGEAR